MVYDLLMLRYKMCKTIRKSDANLAEVLCYLSSVVQVLVDYKVR